MKMHNLKLIKAEMKSPGREVAYTVLGEAVRVVGQLS